MLKHRAFLGFPPAEKELRASTPEKLREFIEIYWLGYSLSEESWNRLLNGDCIQFTGYGSIHLEEDQDQNE